jgi:hypothetical protein
MPRLYTPEVPLHSLTCVALPFTIWLVQSKVDLLSDIGDGKLPSPADRRDFDRTLENEGKQDRKGFLNGCNPC